MHFFLILLFNILLFQGVLSWTGNVVFEDTFDGPSLDLEKWRYEDGCSDLFGGGTLNCYKAGDNNVKLDGGNLVITAKVEEDRGRNYTSGRIIQRTGFTYGAYVARARLTNAKHTWPAIWLFNNDNTCRYEEIDIAEFRGQDLHGLEMAGHFGRRWDSLKSTGEYFNGLPDLSQGFHEFAVLWIPSKIEWYIDNVAYFSVSLTDGLPWTDHGFLDPCGDGAPFSDPAKFIFNIAVGGTFFNGWGDLTIEEAMNWPKPTMEVDWVRIYQE